MYYIKNKSFFHLIIVIFIFLTNSIFSQDINHYDYELIKTLKIGPYIESLRYNSMVMPPGPITFTISQDNSIYVIDSLPKRIVIYNINLDFIKEFTSYFTKLKRAIYFAEGMKIDDFGNVTIAAKGKGLVKIDKEGNEIFYIDEKKLPENIFIYNDYQLIKDKIFFYDDNKLKCINETGIIKNEIETVNILNNLKNNNINLKNSDEKNIELTEEMITYIQDNNMLLINDKLLLSNFHKFKEYINLKESLLQKKSVTYNNINWNNFSYMRHLGFDSDKNNYWIAKIKKEKKWAILVFSKNNDLLDCFYSICSIAAVAPNGDVYMMDSLNVFNDPNYKGVSFYKITRHW